MTTPEVYLLPVPDHTPDEPITHLLVLNLGHEFLHKGSEGGSRITRGTLLRKFFAHHRAGEMVIKVCL